MVEKALLKLPGVASAEADKATSTVVVTYDKTLFQPQTINKLDRYGFSLPESQSSATNASGGESGSAAAKGSESKDTATPPDLADDAPAQQFDLGDFSGLQPNDESSTETQEDVAPLLDGPSDEQ